MFPPKTLAPGALALGLALSSHAAAQDLFAFEPFDYGATSVANLNGSNGGLGWDGPWIGVNSNPLLQSTFPFDFSGWDAGPNQAHGTVSGGYSLDVPPMMFWSGASLQLQRANNEFVDLTPHISMFRGLLRGTISVWFKTNTTGPLTILSATNSATTNTEFTISIVGTRPQGRINVVTRGGRLSSNGLFTPSGARFSDDNWHHLVITVDGPGLMKLYADGELLAEDTTTPTGFFGHVPGLDQMYVGRTVQREQDAEYYNGLIDELAIWGSPLSAADVATLYNATTPTPTPPIPPEPSLPPLLVPGPGLPNGPSVDVDSLGSAAIPHAAFGQFGFTATGNRLSHSSGNRALRKMIAPINLSIDREYYVSFLVRRSDSSATIAPFEIRFSDNSAERFLFGCTDTGEWMTGFTTRAAGAVPQTMAADTTYFVVVKIDANLNGTPDQIFLKAFIDTDTIPPNESSFAGQGPGPNQWTVEGSAADIPQSPNELWLHQLGLDSTIDIDEFRIGTSWAAVTDNTAQGLAAQSTTYGTACDPKSGGPLMSISVSAPPVIGTTFDINAGLAERDQPAFLLLGATKNNVRLGFLGGVGCAIQVGGSPLLIPTAANLVGAITVSVPLPNEPLLVGARLYTQYASAFDPNPMFGTPSPFPFKFSQGLELLLGL